MPPTGTLREDQRRAPLGFLIDRVDGRPLGAPQGVKVTSGTADVSDRFSPGTYITLSSAEGLNRPPFDVLPSGRVLSVADPALDAGKIPDARTVWQIVIRDGIVFDGTAAKRVDLTGVAALVNAAGKPPALSNASPLVTATQEVWNATSASGTFASATAAHQHVRYHAGVAQASADAAAPLNLAGV